ncbi:hypothetical protein SESBI_44802 [Sesbania bispinosa]|nr:hypothetical protein SESBI_44802 [Sesbania bispinosa]
MPPQPSLMDEQCGVIIITDYEIRSTEGKPNRAHSRCAPPILLEGLALPSEGGNTLAIDGSNDVVLR